MYEQLGLAFPREIENAYRHEALRHPKNAHGAHVYALEEFGLDPDRLAERFADYHAEFGLNESARPGRSARPSHGASGSVAARPRAGGLRIGGSSR